MVRVHRDVVVSVGSRATQVIALPAAPGWSGQRAVVRADVCLNERPPAMWPAVWFERLAPTPRGVAQVERKVYDNGAGAFERVLPAQ